jgi:glycosyltransferase involved in cell wall biosynthesis
MSRPRFSFIVPFRRNLADLAQVLAALSGRPANTELFVVADGAEEDCRFLVARFGGRLLATPQPSGPAAARNLAAAVAAGDVLVFIDADVVVSRKGLDRLETIFRSDSDLTAAFGCYDLAPACAGFFSQYKNLSHSYVHRRSAGPAQTFWAGFGAVRRRAFLEAGGFDEHFRRPSVEDIDLGYRLTRAGHRILLDPALSACHLKRWTLRSIVVSDVRDRGVPWVQLMLRYRALNGHLNVDVRHRWSTVAAWMAIVVAMWSGLSISTALVIGVCVITTALLNREYYAFMRRVRGSWFACRAFAMQSLQHVYNAFSCIAGVVLFVAHRARERRADARTRRPAA